MALAMSSTPCNGTNDVGGSPRDPSANFSAWRFSSMRSVMHTKRFDYVRGTISIRNIFAHYIFHICVHLGNILFGLEGRIEPLVCISGFTLRTDRYVLPFLDLSGFSLFFFLKLLFKDSDALVPSSMHNDTDSHISGSSPRS